MKDRCYMAVDLGATSGRVVLGYYDGTKVEMRELSRFKNPMIPMAGHLHWDLPALYNEILHALRLLSAQGVVPLSIGIDSWGCDFAMFGSDGRLLGLPYCYRDSHTEGAMPKLFERVSREEVYDRTGIQFMEFNSLFQLDTLRRGQCSALEHAHKVAFIPDALTYLLTGKCITESTVASTSQMLNVRAGDLDETLLDAIGMRREQFGDLTQPGTVVGMLTKQVQQATGMPAVPVVAVAGHDTASAVVAVPAKDEQYAYLSCGTWSLLGVESKVPIVDAESLRQNFTNEGGVDGTVRFLKNICGMWLLEQCRDELNDAPANVADLVALCATSNFEGLIDPDDAAFAHPDSMKAAIEEYCQSTGQPVPVTAGDFCRCIFRSLALRYRQVLSGIEGMIDFAVRRLHVIGGGSQNQHLMQMTANAIGKTVVSGPVEGTALGNILLQLKAAGQVETLIDMRKVSAASVKLAYYEPQDVAQWDDLYARFVEIQTIRNK